MGKFYGGGPEKDRSLMDRAWMLGPDGPHAPQILEKYRKITGLVKKVIKISDLQGKYTELCY